jgi:hypothetical protein
MRWIRVENHLTCRETRMRITIDFSEMMQARKEKNI